MTNKERIGTLSIIAIINVVMLIGTVIASRSGIDSLTIFMGLAFEMFTLGSVGYLLATAKRAYK